MRRFVPVLSATLAFLLACAVPFRSALAAALDLPLTFGSLPSVQGFSYAASGAHAGVPEASAFAVSGGVLIQTTVGLSNGVSGGSIFYQRLNGITTTEAKQIRVRARCLAVEGSGGAPSGEGGFIFGFATGATQYAFGLTPTRISVLRPSGTLLIAGTFDNTQFHDYVFDWSAGGAFKLYRDGTQVFSGSGGFAVAANRVFFGDGTGGANANGETSGFRFIQDVATPAAGASWGRIKGLYRGR